MKKVVGELIMTRGINDTISENLAFAGDVMHALKRFASCDWGEMDEADIQSNNDAYENGDQRLLASYETAEGKIWIITEWDRSYTTVLFPSEY